MKSLVLRVTGETQRDLYHALQKATEMVDEEFTSASAFISCSETAPRFSFRMGIADSEAQPKCVNSPIL